MRPEDVDLARAAGIRRAVRARYREFAEQPGGHFPYPTGRESALGLGYEADWLQDLSDAVVDRFVGVGNPFRVHRPERGTKVLDVGCGGGLDLLVVESVPPEMLEDMDAWST